MHHNRESTKKRTNKSIQISINDCMTTKEQRLKFCLNRKIYFISLRCDYSPFMLNFTFEPDVRNRNGSFPQLITFKYVL